MSNVAVSSKHSLRTKYQESVSTELQKKFSYSSPMQIPRIKKIVLNMGVGEAINDKRFLDAAFEQMMLIAGQKPIITKARKSIAGFKIRDGYPLGCKVTLRGHHMWFFLDRLIHAVIPRIRDFRGLSTRSFDGFGNYAMGIKEQIVFPEIDFDKVDKIRGMDIVIETSAPTNEEGLELLKLMGFPFVQR